ncbi:MAG: hypothetical protein FJ405_14160 [Verrucomicrobia bacterium]|nr:hypothetical protein [Verrucomicrobiota bacterium]
MSITDELQLAGLAHIGILVAGACMPAATGIRAPLKSLPEFPRRLFWVYFIFLAVCIAGFGTVSILMADDLASGTPLARAVCAFLGTFWLIQCAVALFVFDLTPFLTTPARKLGHLALNITFIIPPLFYFWTAVTGGKT